MNKLKVNEDNNFEHLFSNLLFYRLQSVQMFDISAILS